MTTHIHCSEALLPDGWAADVDIRIGADGIIERVAAGAARPPGAPARPIVIPGIANLHCHAFQYAMAGLAERAAGDDDFWSWRGAMYRIAARVDPETLEAIAARLYAAMLRRGYTAVGEFHYLHNDPDGNAYATPGAMAHRLAAAAARAGIAMTLLPVLYTRAGFDDAPPEGAQRRFAMRPDAYLDMLHDLGRDAGILDARIRVGMAPHSLRAVGPAALTEAVAAFTKAAPDAPIHIHAAEQAREVTDSIAALGARPVDWVLDNLPVDSRWCLVHATHMTEGETRRLAASGAVAGLCPTTEANLGDGLFPAVPYLDAGGAFGVGSDSNVTVDPSAELRLLEYGQRLVHQRRNLLGGGQPHVGAALYRAAAIGGARALGISAGAVAPGRRADLVVLDPDHPSLYGRSGDAVLDGHVFAGDGETIREVIVGGETVVARGAHRDGEAIAAAYRLAISPLLA